MKELKLSNSDMVALVDDDDWEELSQLHWRLKRTHHSVCVVMGQGSMGKHISLHSYLLKPDDPDLVIDHRDRNPLNNQRSNLRLVTQSQSNVNRGHFNTNGSGAKGVYFNKRTKGWYIQFRNKTLSHHPTMEDAVAARQKAVDQYWAQSSQQEG
jgi:hypothetical protein